jgi:hypothetical protein
MPGSDGSAEAAGYVVGTGVHPIRSLRWEGNARLNVILAQVDFSADDGVRAYFFANGAFVGNDVDDGSIGLRAVRVSSTEISLVYRLYDGTSPGSRCCFTGKTIVVRFQLTGMTLTRLDPIPEPGFRV